MARRYTDAFKAEAVRQVEQGKDVTEVARRLGVSRGMLYRWIDQAGTAEPKKAGESELARLKRENADLKEENSFLKKAAAYFAKERPRGTR